MRQLESSSQDRQLATFLKSQKGRCHIALTRGDAERIWENIMGVKGKQFEGKPVNRDEFEQRLEIVSAITFLSIPRLRALLEIRADLQEERPTDEAALEALRGNQQILIDKTEVI